MRARLFSIAGLLLGFMFFVCQLPAPPSGPEEARVLLIMATTTDTVSSKSTDNDTITETAGNLVGIGAILDLTHYIDSVTIKIELRDSLELFRTFRSQKDHIDTVFYNLSFISAGHHTVTVIGYIKEQLPIVIRGTVFIKDRPPLIENRKPNLSVPILERIGADQTLEFSVSATDPDADQQVSIQVLKKPENATFSGGIFRWTPTMADTGIDTVIFVANDNVTPKMSDTKSVVIIVSATAVDRTDKKAPVISHVSPATDSLKVSSSSIKVTVICKDESGIDSLKCFMESTTFNVVKSDDSTYSATVVGLQESIWSRITFIAEDASPAANRCTLSVYLKYDKTAPDNLPPVITFQSPSKDTVIGADSFEVKVTCVDESGCSVKGYRNGTAFTLKKSSSVQNLWVGMVTGIPAGNYATVKIVAEDSSTAKNRDSVSIRIKYVNDDDKSGPVVTLVTPDKDSVITRASSYTIVLKCTDASGVFSVIGTSGSTEYTGVRDTGTVWKISINALEANKYTMVILTAADSALRANKTLDTLYIKRETTIGYIITFDKNDAAATGTMAEQTINSGESAKLLKNLFVKEGATFAGWMTSPTGTTVAYVDGANYTIGTANVTLYAKWTTNTHSITFDKNDGAATGTMPAQVIAEGMSAQLTLNSFKKSGWDFTGWATTANGEVVYNDEDSYTMGSSEIVLYAKWSQNSYIITFNKNDASATGTMSNQTIASGATVSLNNNTFSKPGWTFAGWATTSSGNVAYADRASYTMGTANVTLYAKWTIVNHAVTFDKNDAAATGTMNPQTIAEGTSAPLTANAFSKPGWNFAGWATSSTGSAVYNNQDVYQMGTGNVTLYAKWTAQLLSVTFNKNDVNATGNMADQKIYSGSTSGLNSCGYTKAGWTFAGWATSSSGPKVYDNQATYTMGTTNSTLYAKWTPNNYTITFLGNNLSAQGSMTPQSIPSGSTAKLKANAFIVGCNTFLGWATSESGTVQYTNQADYTMGTSDITLYAKWGRTPLTVSPSASQTFDSSGCEMRAFTFHVSVNPSDACVASFEWHTLWMNGDLLITDNMGYEGATTSTLIGGGNSDAGYYCIVTDHDGNKIKSGTWYTHFCAQAQGDNQ